MASRTSAEVVVRNPQGMHLRPATEFARLAMASGCAVRVKAGDLEANGTSVLELAMMGIAPGTTIVITAEGDASDRVVAELVELVRRDFRN